MQIIMEAIGGIALIGFIGLGMWAAWELFKA